MDEARVREIFKEEIVTIYSSLSVRTPNLTKEDKIVHIGYFQYLLYAGDADQYIAMRSARRRARNHS